MRDSIVIRIEVGSLSATQLETLMSKLHKAKARKAVRSINLDISARNKQVRQVAIVYNYKVYSTHQSQILDILSKYGKVQVKQ